MVKKQIAPDILKEPSPIRSKEDQEDNSADIQISGSDPQEATEKVTPPKLQSNLKALFEENQRRRYQPKIKSISKAKNEPKQVPTKNPSSKTKSSNSDSGNKVQGNHNRPQA